MLRYIYMYIFDMDSHAGGWYAVILSMTTLTVMADICSTIEQTGIPVEYPFSMGYWYDLANYWSAACSDLKPKCIAAPSNAAEVSRIILELHHFTTPFAIKSGGHMPNNGFASIQDGLLISTRKLSQVNYNSNTQTAVVGPGISWEDAQKGLIGMGRTLVGGRIGEVGVGGYTLGGGMSFLSTQYGWAANNVVNYEIVMANGTISNANAQENVNLFASLKGGGNNFGVVTAFEITTHEDHKVWGGNCFFTSDKAPQLLKALRNFVDDYPDDKAAIILTAEHSLLMNLWIMFLFYDGPQPPVRVFDEFTAIEHTSTTKTWDKLYDLLKNNDAFVMHGQRYTIATETSPTEKTSVPNATGSTVLQQYYDYWFNITSSVLEIPNAIGSIAFQPVPMTSPQKSQDRGGDLLNFPTDTNCIILEMDFSYSSSSYDERIDQANQELYRGLDNLIRKNIDEGLLPDVYRPLFMNDFYFRQDYWSRIDPESKQLALQTRLDVDPQGFFQRRMSGGWRLE
ncbi:hypothetical protein N7495_007332 [Penicillium taxi]|uniref:uncharacterized protein n=1 Tax=Penicillium taxi TaxID=168475 RepID=UPI002544E908|nr:uncharacterized protein N7495_007332 [Penicillium taxi]KAJ5895641.1 hypothetical protein N7495_007332 [Penicillium taxi]